MNSGFETQAQFHLGSYAGLIANLPIHGHAFLVRKNHWDRHANLGLASDGLLDQFWAGQDSVLVSRGDLFRIGAESNFRRLVVGTLLWGYPTGGRGRNVEFVLHQLDDIAELISRDPDSDWSDIVATANAIKGLGPATFTKFLYFAKHEMDGNPCLILDETITRCLSRSQFVELEPLADIGQKPTLQRYSDYLRVFSDVADQLDVDPDQIEMFIYTFARYLKPSAT